MSKPSLSEWVFSLLRRQYKIEMPHQIRKHIVRALLILSCMIPFFMAWTYFGSRSLPWGSDGGELLKYANALEADVVLRLGFASPEEIYWKLLPMWGTSVWQYPPLFIILLSLTNRLFDPIFSIKLLGSLTFSLQPIPAFLITKRIAKSDIAGLLAAFGSSMAPLYIEMLGWGGYPNLLGFLLMGFAVYFILCAMENPSKGNILKVIVPSMLLALTHHLTFIIYMGTLAGWALLMIIFKKKDEKVGLYAILAGLGSSMASFLLYRFTLAWPPSFILFNEAAYYELRFEPLRTIPWVFKDSSLIIIVGLVTFTILFVIKGVLDKRYMTLLFSWIAFPLMATFGFLFGVAIDYLRVFFFIIQPLIILSATPIALIRNSKMLKLTPPFRPIKRMLNASVPFRVNFRKLGIYTLIILSVLAPLSTLKVGITTVDNVNNFFNSIDSYGDREKLAALDWIARNTFPNDTFVTEGLMTRWIEGYSIRRVFLYTDPKFFFIEGELNRYYVASSIFESNYEARNCYMRVLDQAPYNTRLSPQIHFWFRGRYHEYLSFNDFVLVAKVSLDDKLFVVSSFTTANVTSSSIRSNEDEAVIQVTYENSLLKFEKSIRIVRNSPKVVLAYSFFPVNSSITLNNATIAAFLSTERRIDLIESGSEWARVASEVGSILISAQNASITSDPKAFYTKGIYITFLSGIDGRIKGLIEVSFIDAEERNCSLGLEAHSREELIREYNVSYIVLPRTALEGVKSYSKYQHLLDDKGLKITYLSDKVIILKAS